MAFQRFKDTDPVEQFHVFGLSNMHTFEPNISLSRLFSLIFVYAKTRLWLFILTDVHVVSAKLFSMNDREVVNIFQDDFREIIQKYGEKINYVPTHDTRVGTDEGKTLLFIYNALLYAGLTENKVGPGCEVFPGFISVQNLKLGLRIKFQ